MTHKKNVMSRGHGLKSKVRSFFGLDPKPLENRFPTFTSDEPWLPTHQHSKGGKYRVLAKGILEADETPMVIYDDAAGKIWIRPVTEFEDGRFTPLE